MLGALFNEKIFILKKKFYLKDNILSKKNKKMVAKLALMYN